MSTPNASPHISHLDVSHELCAVTTTVLQQVSSTVVYDASMILNSAKSVYVLGVGHSGLLSRILTMKLNHVGLKAYTVFDETCPRFDQDSVLVAVSQSGETATVTTLAEKARQLGGGVLAFTGRGESTIGRFATVLVELPIHANDATCHAFSGLGDAANQNVRGAFFGHALYSVFYSIILVLAQIRDETPHSINKRHANLE